MNARSVPCPYCKAGKGQECRSMYPSTPRKKVLDHTARKREIISKPKAARWRSSPTPWSIKSGTWSSGESVKIVDAQGFTVAVMQGAGREANAKLVTQSVNIAQA